jgi:cellulose synthase/poly-beta-1,6-N-acetylglucosamine synthase-like glycosyltransferase
MHALPITVLMPCRDAAATVRQAAYSILRQKGGVDLRLLAIDDGSQDGTPGILRNLSANDKRVDVLLLERSGLATTLNRGLARVDTPLVARQDADDVSHPDRLRCQLEMICENPELDVVGCCLRGFPSSAVRGGMRRYEEWQNNLLSHEQMQRELFVESPLAHATALLKTDTLRAAGGWREFDGPEDWDLWARLFGKGSRFGKVARTLYFWREHEERATRKDPRLSPAKFRETKCDYLIQGPLSSLSGVELWSHGNQGQDWVQLLRSQWGEGLVHRPLNPKSVMTGKLPLPVFPPADGGMVLVAYGTSRIRNWFRKAFAARGGREGTDYILLR